MGDAITPMNQFRSDIAKLRPEFQMAMPPGFDADRMSRMCITVVNQNPGLLECTRKSLLGAMMTAAQLGLYPDVSVLGHAYFLPFKVKGVPTVTFVAGYKGLIDLARRSGHVTSIMAYEVFDGDEFKYAYGTAPFITHVPSTESLDGRDLIHVYAMAKLRGEKQPQFIVMSREQIESVRKRAPRGNAGPWVEHYNEMAKKTAIRRLCKYLPLSSHLQRAVALDEAADAGVDQRLESVVDMGALDDLDDGIIEGELAEEIDTVDSLDALLSEMKSSSEGPNPYEQLCIQGMEKFGDTDWKKKLSNAKTAIAKKSLEPDEAREALMTAISVLVRKGE